MLCCPKCNSTFPSGNFCGKCGGPLSVKTSGDATPAATATTMEPPAVGQNTDSSRATSSASSAPPNLRSEVIASAQRETLSQLAAFRKCVVDAKEMGEIGCPTGLGKIDEWLGCVDEEKRKVGELQYLVAIVGTVSAGKSTTINAIVGREVLANRNSPMTILPTVITHRTGYTEPRLCFPKREPFDNLIAEIRKRLRQAKNQITVLGDHARTLARIREGSLTHIEDEYRGQEAIYSFMESINDLVRLARDRSIDLPNPLDRYTNVEQFPQIEVEFGCLKSRFGGAAGKLSLLDTPGMNEAGQAQLRGIVKDQLQKASAIISVLDFTQLKTEADDELRRLVNQARKISGAAVHAFVNKYDARHRHDMTAEEAKDFVANELFPPVKLDNGNELAMRSDHVYLVSAKRAFLANLALEALEEHGRLPSLESSTWVEDFAQSAYGMEWEEDIQETNKEKHKQASDRLWRKSGMEAPMADVIKQSMAQVVPNCLRAALETLDCIRAELSTASKRRRKSMDESKKTLEETIKKLEDALSRLDAADKNAEKLKASVLQVAKSETEKLFDALREETSNLFQKRAQKEAERQDNKKKREEKNREKKSLVKNIVSKFLGNHEDNKSDMTRLMNNDGPIEFDDRDEAIDFVVGIQKTVKSAMDKQVGTCCEQLTEQIGQLEKNLASQLDSEVKPIVEQLNRELKKVFDLSISLKLPNLKPIKIDIDTLKRQAVEKKEKEVTRYRDVGWFEGLKFWPHEESYSATKEYFVVDPKSIRKRLDKSIEDAVKSLQKHVDSYLQEEFDDAVKRFFSDLSGVMVHWKDNIRGDLKAKTQDAAMQKAWMKTIDRIDVTLVELGIRSKKHMRFTDNLRGMIGNHALMMQGNGAS